MLRARYLIVVVAAIAACWFAVWSQREIRAADPNVAVAIDGRFPAAGEYPTSVFPFGSKLRHWGSYGGADENTGTVSIGPLVAPRSLRFAVTGYPQMPGNEITIERADTHERRPVSVTNPGSDWTIVTFDLPATWVGHPVMLIAIDHSTQFTGWFGISEPLRGGIGDGNTALYQTLGCWLLNGLLLGLCWQAAWHFVSRWRSVPAIWAPLTAAAVVAAAGYLLFWLYFASPALGKMGSIAVLVVAAMVAWRKRREAASAEQRTAATLIACVGFTYIALLHLFPSALNFYDLSANRFREGMPPDNRIPWEVAMKLYDGETLRPPGTDWLTSDRPPLQSGWQLITLPVTSALRLDTRTATGTSAIWFQLTWVSACLGMLLELGVARRRAAAWVVSLALTGFFAENTVFTWPKLSAGAFGCGAFALWVLPSATTAHSRCYGAGAFLAALASLSHGGIAFSFLALAPWIVWRAAAGELRHWAVAALIFLALALPWFAFQTFYNPPGDRLVKMHLAGKIEKDPRSAWTVIREAYRQKSEAEIVRNKETNFRLLTLGTWRALFDFGPSTRVLRQNDEFFCTFRALTWWLPAPVVLVIAVMWRRATRSDARRAPTKSSTTSPTGWWRTADAALASWAAATLVIWCLLMFGPYTTAIHQGSYATMLVLFVLGCAWFERAGRWWLAAVAVLQIATFATTWAGVNAQIHGAPVGWPFVCAAALVMAWLMVSGTSGDRSASAQRRLDAE